MRLIRDHRRRSFAVVVLSVVIVSLSACASNRADGPAGADSANVVATSRLRVVASFYPLAFVARRIGGDRVAVSDLTPPGVEPHELELDSSQVDAIQDAALAVVLGGGFQPSVERAAQLRSGETVLARTALNGGGNDPHVWLDPVSMVSIVRAVRDGLILVDPAGRDGYAANARELETALSTLDAQYANGLRHCARTDIVTSHEAFGWLSRRYGLTQHGIAGFSPEAEPDPQRLATLADLVRRTGVTTIFSEELASPKLARTLAREAGVTTEVLDPLESLSPHAGAGADYLSVMRSNLAILRTALDCP